MGGPALGRREERVARWERGCLGREVLFHPSVGFYTEQRASFKILSIKLPACSFKLHLNENEDHDGTSKLKSLLLL